ncbi:MAG: collagen binding domain-containing protein [Armatimonadota bacterium]
MSRWRIGSGGTFQGAPPADAAAGLVVRRDGRIVGWIPHYSLGDPKQLALSPDAGVRVVVPLQTPEGIGSGLKFAVRLMLHGVGWVPWRRGSAGVVASDSNGRLVLKGIPSGASVRLDLLDDRYANAPTLTMFGAGSRSERRLAPVVLTRAGEIHGQLREASGRPAAGVQVRLRRAASFLDTAVRSTDSAGRFRFRGLASGAYGVVSMPWMRGGERLAVSIVEPIQVEGGRTTRLEVAIGQPTGALAGRAVSARDGTAAAGVVLRAVSLEATKRWVGESVADAAGSFSIAVPAGRYRVVGNRFDSFLGEVSRIRIEPNEVEISAGERISLQVIVGTSNQSGK